MIDGDRRATWKLKGQEQEIHCLSRVKAENYLLKVVL